MPGAGAPTIIVCVGLWRLSVNGLMNGDHSVSPISMQMHGQPTPMALQLDDDLELGSSI